MCGPIRAKTLLGSEGKPDLDRLNALSGSPSQGPSQAAQPRTNRFRADLGVMGFVMRIILKDIDPDDFVLAIRAARWMLDNAEKKDAIIAYGEGSNTFDFYVRRNLSSVTVRKCKRASTDPQT